jgi:23S rRNA (adenine2503-C2)-methyltransferase
VSPTLTVLNDPRGLGIGARHITVSTVGVLPGIVALGERPEQFRLAISIHAPSDELRQQLMPINTKYPLREVIEAAKVFDRRVTFEYVMLGGVNDQADHARQLATLARECRAFVNLIPLHPGGSQGFVPTPSGEIARFARLLRERGVEVAVRKSRGMDIAAACGQLRVERLGRRTPRAADQHGDVQVA